MKLSSREKKLFFILFVVLIGYGYYYFIFLPINNHINQLENKVTLAKQSLKEYQLKAIPENKIYEEYENALRYTDSITHQYYPEIIQEEIILNLKALIEKLDIEVSSMNFSSPIYTMVIPRNNIDKTNSKMEELAQSFLNHPLKENTTPHKLFEESEKVQYMSITINFTGNFDKVKKFINKINENRYRLIINSLLLNSMNEGELFMGSIIIDVYSIPHLTPDNNIS